MLSGKTITRTFQLEKRKSCKTYQPTCYSLTKTTFHFELKVTENDNTASNMLCSAKPVAEEEQKQSSRKFTLQNCKHFFTDITTTMNYIFYDYGVYTLGQTFRKSRFQPSMRQFRTLNTYKP